MFDLIGKTLGPYRITDQIGVGGMATVYKAYQPSMDRYVAVKVLPFQLSKDEQFTKRFQREARAIAKLEHAHILPVHDYGEYEGIAYIVMRYVEAGTLKDYMAQRPLSLDEVERLIGQIGGALDYAHRLGVIHRDIKPGNVLIDEQKDTYLTDFGLARMMEPSQQLTASGVGVGTPAYMSPEQGQGVKADHRSDIYSLGVILYEMVVGRVPFEAETPLAVVLKHITDPLPLPSEVNPNVPEPIERVILKALAKAPADRFQTAGEMAQALSIAIRKTAGVAEAEGRAIKVTPPREDVSLITRVQRVWETPRGKLSLVGGALAAVVLLGWLLSLIPGSIALVGPGATATAGITTQATAVIARATSEPTQTTAAPTDVPATASPTATSGATLPVSVADLRWEQIYDGASFLRVALNALAVDPNDPSIIFAGTVGAGIYVSRDGGKTWEPSSEGLGKGTVGSIVIDPKDSNIAYAALFDTGGVYKSTDGGRTWQAANNGLNLDTEDHWKGLIYMEPPDSQHLYYSGGNSLYQSSDGGAAWRQLSSSCPASLSFASIDPADGEHLYVSTRSDATDCPAGIYETTDRGRTWTRLTTPEMIQESGTWWHVTADPRNFDIIYAGSWASTYKSSDGGQAWTQIRNDGCRWMVVHPDDGTVYCGQEGQLQISRDGGVSWSQASFGPNWGDLERFPFALVPSMQTLYAGMDAVMKSDDGGRTWNFQASFGLPRMRLSVDPRDGNRLFLGGWPGTNVERPCESYRSDNGGSSWRVIVANADGGCLVSINPANSAIYRTGGWESRLYRSTDNGENWQQFGNNLPQFINSKPQVIPHPDDPAKFWLITDGPGIYLSRDGGEIFDPIENLSQVWQSILLAHSAGERLYVVANNAVYRSDDGGETWRLMGSGPGGDHRAGAVDLSNPEVVYVGSTHKGMFKTTNGARSWFQLSNLPATSINDIAIDPANPQTVYAATDSGAFVSLDGGEQWARIQDGLGPNPIVYSIAVDPNDSTRVFTVTPDGVYRLEGAVRAVAASTESACPALDSSQVERRSKPAILFDEAHGNGLSLTEEKARQIDPRPQLFPYAGDLADFIRQQGYWFEALETGSISLTGLSSYDLLIVSVGVSSLSFNACEIEAVKAFVENGGGLLVLGDGRHNNEINILLKPFGIRMTGRPVATISELPGNFWVIDFSGHPATDNTTYAWFNWGTNIEILDEAWSVLMDSPKGAWLDENMDRITDESEPRGPFVLGAAREYGRGRIIVYGDNNVWDFYRDPNYPMYLAMIQWAIGDLDRSLPQH